MASPTGAGEDGPHDSGCLRSGLRREPRRPVRLLGPTPQRPSTGSPRPRRCSTTRRPPFYRWFPGASLNTCFNALDRHVAAGRGDQAALLYDSPVTGTKRTLTYAELLDQVARFAGALQSLGVEKGDRVVIYMPMVPEARRRDARLRPHRRGPLGRLRRLRPGRARRRASRTPSRMVVVAASCGIEPSRVVEYKPMLDAALDRSSHKPEAVIVLQREQARAAVGERDTDWEEMEWDELMADAEPADCVEVAATDPLYILYTSGTTGRPKGIVRDNGGHAVALRWSMENIYDIGPGDVWFTASDVGWVVGPLLHRLRAAAHRRDDRSLRGQAGRHPGRRRLLAGHRRLRRQGHVHRPDRIPGHQEGGPGRHPAWPAHDLSSPADACSSPASGSTPTPTSGPRRSSACRSSTTGGRPRPAGRSRPTCAGSSRCRSSPGSPSVPVPGVRRAGARRARRSRCPPGTEGAICIRLPLPPGTLPTLWEDDERYVAGYLVGLRGLLPDRRRRDARRGRLPLRHGAHRRRAQRRRAPALDRVDRGGARGPRGRGRVRRHRRRATSSRARSRGPSSCSRAGSTRLATASACAPSS